jgi:hypothetical protein
LRGRFSVGRVVAALALVVALVAISVPAIGKTSSDGPKADSDASASATGKRGPRGKRGKTGKTGPQGPAGPAGARGLQGPAGPKGDTGATGAAGATGATGAQGPQGIQGLKGDPGDDGEDGSPWTAGGTLPPGATQTGSWKAGPLPAGTEVADFAPISFPIPLADGVAATLDVVPVPESGPVPASCDDGVAPAPSASHPEADPNTLCVFTGFNTGAGSASVGGILAPDQAFGAGAASTGAIVLYGTSTGAEGAFAWGTFAVTAPNTP